MTIVANKVAETNTYRAYEISFNLEGVTSAIFDATKEGTKDKDEILLAVLNEIKSAKVEIYGELWHCMFIDISFRTDAYCAYR